jgi:hypothetical protein
MTPDPPRSTMTAAPRVEGTRSAAAKLRADLTHLLTEHVYAAGPGNDEELADLIEGLYGPSARRRFTDVWRRQDPAAIGAFVHATVPTLRAFAVEASFRAGTPAKPTTTESRRIAASHMQGTARLLARGIVSEQPTAFSGSVEAAASTLRSRLTALLTEHVHLVRAVLTRADPTAPRSLKANTASLVDAFTATHGAATARRVGGVWEQRIAILTEYARAAAARNARAQQAARLRLHGTRGALAELLGAEGLAAELEAASTALLRAAGSPADLRHLRHASAHMAATAAFLSDVIARQKPERFPSA